MTFINYNLMKVCNDQRRLCVLIGVSVCELELQRDPPEHVHRSPYWAPASYCAGGGGKGAGKRLQNNPLRIWPSTNSQTDNLEYIQIWQQKKNSFEEEFANSQEVHVGRAEHCTALRVRLIWALGTMEDLLE